jgi:hypothetical protein
MEEIVGAHRYVESERKTGIVILNIVPGKSEDVRTDFHNAAVDLEVEPDEAL